MAMKTGAQEGGKKESNEENTSVPRETETTQKDLTMQAILQQMKEMQATNLKLQAKVEKLEATGGKQTTPGITPEIIAAIAKTVADARRHETFDNNFDEGFVKEVDIDPDDVLDEKSSVTFFAHTIYNVIVGGIRSGKQVRTPFGNKIEFRYANTFLKGTGRSRTTMPYCTYTSHSKKEVKWLMEDSRFGRVYYRSINDIINTDADTAQKTAQIYNSVNDMLPHQLIARCKEKNIEVGINTDVMKAALVMKMIGEQKALQALRSQNAVRQTKEAALFLTSAEGKE